MASKIKLRRDTAAIWQFVNPLLSEGEPGLELDTSKIKYGNGVDRWNDLPYSFVDSADYATYSAKAGVSTYADVSGISTVSQGLVGSPNVQLGFTTITGVGNTALIVNGDVRIIGILTIGTSSLVLNGFNNTINIGYGTTITEGGNAIYSGIITAPTFDGNATSATYASVAGVTTALQTPRTISLTGDLQGSVSFDGTSDVSISASVKNNSVSLGSDTTGDYVQSISGTVNQISVSNGSAEGSTPTLSIPNQFNIPRDATVDRDLQVNRNLNVSGNITIGGTSATLFTTELKVSDPDLVLGIRTDGSGNDVSTDNTANHGGISIASTEGSPLIEIYNPAIGENTPTTYKKFMWFKSGTFSGLGTDAWISNYAIGIGSTQFPSGTRLAAGNVQITQNDISVVRNINASGVVTATTFVGTLNGNASSATYATTAGIATSAQSITGTPNIVAGVITATSYNGSGSNLTGIVTSITAGANISINQSTGNVTITGIGVTSGTSSTYTGNNTFSGITTFSGNVVSTGVFQAEQVVETYNTYSATISNAAVVLLDCSAGNTFYITSNVNGNWTANLTNLNINANTLTNVTLLIVQGAAAYIPNALQIGGVSQSINWQGGASPSGNANKKDAIAFTIFYTGSVYNIFGQLVSFG